MFREVHWSEGMFLRPQYLQAQTRHDLERLVTYHRVTHPYLWGVRRLEIDTDEIQNYVFSVKRCQVWLPDGVLLEVPGNAELPSRDFREELDAQGGILDVSLGLPRWREGHPNVGEPSETESARRFRTHSELVGDENTGGNAVPMPTRLFGGRLLLSGEETGSFVTLPLARIQRRSDLDATPELHPDVAPPLIEIGAHPALIQVCNRLYQTLLANLRQVGDDILSRGLSFSAYGGGDAEKLLRLHALNGELPVLSQMVRTSATHPYDLYLQLCRLGGCLSVFSAGRLAEELPPYDHFDPVQCFRAASDHILALLGNITPDAFVTRLFNSDPSQPDRQLCTLDAGWDSDHAELYLGIEGPLDEKQLDHLLQNTKLAAPTRVTSLWRSRAPGIELSKLDRLPLQLPPKAGLQFRRILCKGEEWKVARVENNLALMQPPSAEGTSPRFTLFVVFKEGPPKGR
ncbi:MAG: type VI secretion system baseplate subunit TssK [Planctomycetota bacterium]